MVKIRTLIADTVKNSKVSDTEKQDILERASEKCGKGYESECRSKISFLEETAQENASIKVSPSSAPMFQSLKLPANRSQKLAKFLKFDD